MPVRIISWNIKNYAENVFNTHRNTILDEIWDAGGGASKCDIFVIIEPMVGTTPTNVGSYIAGGAGARGVMQLYYALWALSNTWRVVPPRASCAGSKADFCAILYDSAVVTLLGPDTAQPIVAPAALAGAGGAPNPWGPPLAGQIRFYKTPGNFSSGNEIGFSGRRPYAVQFGEAGAVAATAQRVFNLNVAAVAPPAAAPGVFAVKTAALPPAAHHEPYLAQLEAENPASAVAWTSTALPAGLALDGATGEISGVPAAGAATAAVTVTATDSSGPVTAVLNLDVGPLLRFATPAALPPAVANVAYDLQIAAVGGFPKRTYALTAGVLPLGLTLEADGRLHGTTAAAGPVALTIDVTDAGNSFFLVALHAPPDGGKNYPKNANVKAMQNVATIRELTTERGRCPVVIVGDYNCCSLVCCTAKHNAAFASLNLKFTHQDFAAKTSLKSWKANAGSDVGITADYRSHYFDHIYTAGFAAVANHAVLDLVRNHPRWAAWAGGSAPDFDAIFDAIAWTQGVSDHLPIKVDVTL